MIDEALIKITVKTEEDLIKMEIINDPDAPEKTLREYTENHPAHAIAHGIIMKINQELKRTSENMEKEKK